MKRFIRKLLSAVMIVAMSFAMLGAAAFASPVSAASKTALSKKTVTVKKSSKKTIRLKNARKRVYWKTSNKKVVKIVKIKGKNRSTVTFKGLKKGKATITATCGKKKYKCKVIVKDPNAIEILPLSKSSVNLSKTLKRTPAGNKAVNEQFCGAVTDFSIDLFKKVSKGETDKGSVRSILVSPDSVETALAMLENGAAGDTLTEMEAAMGGGMDTASFCSYLAGMNERLEASRNIIFEQANSIWAKKNEINVNQDFLQKNKNYFDAEYYVAPFDNVTADDMNKWVYNNTRNMIRRVIDQLNKEDRMVLINTTVFEGKWLTPFENTATQPFAQANGVNKNATMLLETESMNYFTLNGAKCFERKYIGGEISFIGILPPEGTSVDAFVQDLSGSAFRTAWNSRSPQRVQLAMPEFKYDYDTGLEAVLQGMGINKAFTDGADFSGMGTPSVKIDRVIHKTHIELDRYGTKAAAVTAIVAKASSAPTDPPIVIRMDRPFVYALIDTATGIPLFIGSVKTL